MAECTATEIEDVITETGIEIFGAAVTSNASIMVKTMLIVEGKCSHIVSTCAVHTLHLVVGDITKLRSVEDTLEVCKSIVKEIKNPQILRAHFTELHKTLGQICCLNIPVPTK